MMFSFELCHAALPLLRKWDFLTPEDSLFIFYLSIMEVLINIKTSLPGCSCSNSKTTNGEEEAHTSLKLYAMEPLY